MSVADPAAVLRAGLLEGSPLLLATAPASSALAAALEELCSALGASVAVCGLASGKDVEQREAETEQALQAACAGGPDPSMLVVDGPALFALEDGAEALSSCLQATWDVCRACANRVFIASGRGGRIVLIAPAPDAGEHADAARAGLENLARTLSIEWSRYAVTAVAIAPGADTSERELAGVVAFMSSAAGEYFSGCLLDLRGPRRS